MTNNSIIKPIRLIYCMEKASPLTQTNLVKLIMNNGVILLTSNTLLNTQIFTAGHSDKCKNRGTEHCDFDLGHAHTNTHTHTHTHTHTPHNTHTTTHKHAHTHTHTHTPHTHTHTHTHTPTHTHTHTHTPTRTL